MDIPREKTTNKKRYVYGAVAAAGAVLATLGLSRLDPSAPVVDRATIWMDTVERGTMLREVRGPGTLVPEQIRLIPAVTAGRIERRHLQPGTEVTPETVILELSNADVQRELLEAERQLTSAQAEYVSLQSMLENQVLNQKSVVAQTRSLHREAQRQVEANEALASQQLIAPMELQRSRDTAEELAERLEIERLRLESLRRSREPQVEAQRSQVGRLREIVAFQRGLVESMKVAAGVAGVLQELPVEEGQWVTPGTMLARVVQPGRLKAELRIPETQATEVVVGLPALIDTRNGVVRGRVVRVDPSVQNGTVTVDVALEGDLPRGARPDLSVEGTIQIDRIEDAVYVGRPAFGQANSTVGLFVLDEDATEATRVLVRLGAGSVNQVQVMEGLNEGDVVILSDMSNWESAERVRIR
ncbi:MAG TPA: HlyD family efflux transporter periplasmic adaptor subunit [Longimicrobiales bacterium]|nr:HlyD family efflux transporter periplasmic adaptor subunit [Longimicrobiales bacterium]